MIAIALLAQLGFGFALPKEGPLVPFRDCAVAVISRSPVEQLRYQAAAAAVEVACGDLRRAATPQAIDAALARPKVPGHQLTREDFERHLPMLLQLGIMRAVDDELLARGIDPHPPKRLPAIEVPRIPRGK